MDYNKEIHIRTAFMRVAMYYNNKDIRLEEVPRPEIGKGEMLMKVESSGICGTDLLEWYRIHKAPLVLGHEVAGVIEDIGEGVEGFKKGERIAVSHHVPCGECKFCKAGHESVCDMLRTTKFYPGGFAEYIRIPEANIEKGGVYKLPNGLSFDEATFIEPLACVVRGQRIAGMKKSKSVLVIGSGISGLLHIKLARASGASRIFATDILENRLLAAKAFGADGAGRTNTGGPADLVIICAGADGAIEEGIRSVERGGTVLFFAAAGKDSKIPVPANDIFWRNEVTITSSYAASPKEHLDALNLIVDNKVSVGDMITHRLKLEDTVKGFKLVSEGKEALKVIIRPWG